jgi:hypothetical protein
MNRHQIVFATTIAAGVFALMPIRSAHASYQGLQVQLHTQVMAGGAMRDVWRVYATVDDQGDFLTSLAGTPTLGKMIVQTASENGSFPGGTFWNAPGVIGPPNFAGITAPLAEAIANSPEVEWDTFVTIGATESVNNSDETGIPPGFPGIGSVSEFNSDYAACFTAGPRPQGMAGNGIALPGGLWGVICMQLTVNAGNHVRGTASIGGVNNSPLADGTHFQTLADQTFNSFPGPGGLMIVFLAGVMPRRRRS